jgi:hypothetical protein
MRVWLFVAIVVLFPWRSVCQNTDQAKIQDAQVSAVLEAIQDEIYDYGYQDSFWGFETAVPNGPQASFNIYVRPTRVPTNGCHNCLEGVVIYKYLPFGELFRPFVIDSNRGITLIGSPQYGFSWNKPASPTIYMADEDVIKDKQRWLKVPFSIDLSPSVASCREAAARQKVRVGFSKWEQTHKAVNK